MNWVSIVFGISVFGLVTTTILTLHGENLRLETQLSAEKAGRAADRAEAATAAASAAQTYQADLQRVVAEQTEAANEEKKRTDRAVADLAVATASAQRLRLAVAKYAAAASDPPRDSPPAPDVSAATTPPIVVLADVLGRSDDTSGILAAALDAANDAGLQCESDYHSLESKLKGSP